MTGYYSEGVGGMNTVIVGEVSRGVSMMRSIMKPTNRWGWLQGHLRKSPPGNDTKGVRRRRPEKLAHGRGGITTTAATGPISPAQSLRDICK